MSRGGGYVVKDGRTLAYFLYDGSSDVAYSRLFEFYDEAWNTYIGGGVIWQDCTCGQPDEPVRLHTDYGAGSSWNGRICLRCMAITHGRSPWPTDYGYGTPPPGWSYEGQEAELDHQWWPDNPARHQPPRAGFDVLGHPEPVPRVERRLEPPEIERRTRSDRP